MNRIVFILSPLLLLAGCSVSADPQHGVEVLSTYTLDNALKETSGLFCDSNSIYTINDSGNEPELFTLGQDGSLTARVTLDAKNRDWEAITGDDEYFYIGDIGNNAGKHKSLTVYKINRTDPAQEAVKRRFTYAGNTPQENAPYAHDYDGEAMTMRDGKLILFSKSWATEQSHVYVLQDIKAKQVLTPFTSVDGLPGVVTGADWNSDTQEFVLVGYRSNALGMFKPFIATVSGDYQLKTVDFLSQFAQVEGVCYGPDGNVWISQESTPYTSAKLAKLKFH